MRRIVTVLLCTASLTLGVEAVKGQDLLLQPLSGELRVGPIAFSQPVGGISLPLRASAFLVAAPEGDRLRIHVRAVMDLASLQARIGDLVDTIPLPANDCDHPGGDNVFARIWGKSLAIQDRTATVTLHGDVDKWICAPIVFKIRQPFDADLPFTLEKGGAQTVVLKLGKPNVVLDVLGRKVPSQFFDFLGFDLNGEIEQALDQAIAPGSLQIAVPPYLSLLNPDLTRVDFLSNYGKLAVTAEIGVMLDPRAVIELVKALVNRPSGEVDGATNGSRGMEAGICSDELLVGVLASTAPGRAPRRWRSEKPCLPRSRSASSCGRRAVRSPELAELGQALVEFAREGGLQPGPQPPGEVPGDSRHK